MREPPEVPASARAARPGLRRLQRTLALLSVAFVVLLAGCGGDASRATVTLGESSTLSRADVQAAADAVLVRFSEFEGCTLLRLAYDEGFSSRQIGLAQPPAQEGEDIVVFTSDFEVDWTGQRNGMNPNSTYRDWTWTVRRADASQPWTVTNWGLA